LFVTRTILVRVRNKRKPRTTPARVEGLDLVDGLFQLSFRLQGALARIAAEHDLSMVQVRLLGILRDRQPGMLELARHLELEKSSLSGLVDRAEKRGLVERIPSADDRRVANVRVTPRGRGVSRVVEAKAIAEVLGLIDVLSRSERARLASLVGRVMAAGAAGSPP
jgi:DNA-binding MarR family transcriptional regulator